MPNTQIVTEFGISPIESLEGYIVAAGSSLVRATFEHSYFVDPERVRERTPYYPDRARFSGTHYPQLNMGDYANWSGDGRRVRLDANHRPQIAWEGYTRMPIQKSPVTDYATSGGTLGTQTHLRQVGIYATCHFGPVS